MQTSIPEWRNPTERTLAWGFLHGWLAALDGSPCDPPEDIAAEGFHAHHAWIDGWCIAHDEQKRGEAIDGEAAIYVCNLYVPHLLTPRAEMH